MSTIIQDADVFDREVGCSPHWSRSDSGCEPKSFVYPPQALPERRKVVPRPAGPLAPAGECPVINAAAAPGPTPAQWLALWCCLDEQV